MELSTTMPTAKARPARLITFSVRPKAYIARNVPTTLMGIATPMTKVVEALRRYKSKSAKARSPPTKRLCCTSEIALVTYSVSS